MVEASATLSIVFDVDDGPDPDQDAFETAALNLKNGKLINFRRVHDIDDDGWEQVKKYLEINPPIAETLKEHEGDPQLVLNWLKTQALVEHVGGGRASSTGNGVKALTQRLKALESDPEAKVREAIEEIRSGGIAKAIASCNDKDLINLVAMRMGGVPEDLEPHLEAIDQMKVSFHQACKTGDALLVKNYLAANNSVDSKDHFGIAPLGYAIGSGHKNIVDNLMSARASIVAIDCVGNTGIHYAAGYGHPEILTCLVEKHPESINTENNKGETALDVASMNRQALTMEILHVHGAICSATQQEEAMLATSIANIHPSALGMSANSVDGDMPD